jgi:DNA-nicking Smr family endonuclease
MRGRTREPTALELALWHHAVREVVRRVERDTLPPAREPPLSTVAEPAGRPLDEPVAEPGPIAEAAAPRPQRPATPPPLSPTPLDRRTLRRLERGQYPISARLDLHGLDQEAAHDALLAFLARAQERGHRCVLVITGRGERSGGVLRRAVPRWLREPPLAARVLGWAEAGRVHGGAGALYLLLRRSAAARSPTLSGPSRRPR